MIHGRGNIKRWTARKKVEWAQQKSSMSDGHHRPILYPWDMLHINVVPQGEDGVLNRTVCRCPGKQSCTSRMLVWIITRRITLLGMVWGYPEMMPGESGALHDAGARTSKRQNIRVRKQLVAYRLPVDGIANTAIDNLPTTCRKWVNVPLCLRFGLEYPIHHLECIAVRSLSLFCHRVRLLHGVVQAVKHRLQTEAKCVLVNGCVQPIGSEQLPVLRNDPRTDRANIHDACELYIHFYAGVLPEIPEEAILIDTHRGNERNDQPSRSPHLHVICAVIPVFPQDSVILFMHTYGILQRSHAAIIFRHVRIEIVNETKTVTAQFQAVRQPTHSIFPHIKCILETVIRTWISIRYHHFSESDRAEQRPAVVMQIVQNQSLPRGKSDAEIPLLPPDTVPIHRKAWPLRLRDFKRLEIVAHLRNIFRQVIACSLGDGNDTEIVDPDNLHGIKIKDGMEYRDWMGIGVLFRVVGL